MKQYEKISGDIMATWLDSRDKPAKERPNLEIKSPETTFKEGMDQIKNSFKTKKNLKISSLIEPLPHQEMNLNHKYWVTKFLYPFALDTTPIKLSEFPVQGSTIGGSLPKGDQSKIGGDCGNILDTEMFRFPLSHLDHKEEYLTDILNPIIIQKEEIVKDMYKYAREFPTKVIPHNSEFYGIIDIIHNYKRPSHKPKNTEGQDEPVIVSKDKKNAMDSRKPVLTFKDIEKAKEIGRAHV